MASTDIELVAELEKLKGSGSNRALSALIERARRGEYHDYKSQVGAPKMALVHDLRTLGLEGLVLRVMNGEFDEPFPKEEPANAAPNTHA